MKQGDMVQVIDKAPGKPARLATVLKAGKRYTLIAFEGRGEMWISNDRLKVIGGGK